MVRARFWMLMICFLLPVVSCYQTVFAEPTLKLYDLRDLVATVPLSLELDRLTPHETQEARAAFFVYMANAL